MTIVSAVSGWIRGGSPSISVSAIVLCIYVVVVIGLMLYQYVDCYISVADQARGPTNRWTRAAGARFAS
jgi:hypothetical protein